MLLLITIFTIIFTWLAYRKYTFAVGTLFALLPTYLIRFTIGPLPTTLLEIMILVLGIVGVYRYKEALLQTIAAYKKNSWMYYGLLLFIVGATIGILVSVDLRTALGEWKAFYIEPMLLTLILIAASKEENNLLQAIFTGVLISGIATTALVIYQGFTGDFIAPGYQGRATGWYGFPNGVGLFLGMLWGIVLYIHQRLSMYSIPTYLLVSLSPIALYFSRSTGAIIGILGTIGILLLYYRKTRYPAIAVGVIGCILLLSIPSLSPIKQELFLQDRSGQIRVHIWAETLALLKDKPLFGTGLASYDERIRPYHTTVHGEGIEIFHHPHNLFFTIWVNTGLIGLIGFLLLLMWMLRIAIHTKQPYLLAAIGGTMVLGLVDSPYIKNDIALIFWSLILFSYTELQSSKANQTPSET